MRKAARTLLVLQLILTCIAGDHIFLQVPEIVQRRLRSKSHASFPRITALASQSNYLRSLGEDPADIWTYDHFKSFVENTQGELAPDEDVSQVKKMQCSCTFKKLFVNTIENGFTDLMIGKIKPGKLDFSREEESPTNRHPCDFKRKKEKIDESYPSENQASI